MEADNCWVCKFIKGRLCPNLYFSFLLQRRVIYLLSFRWLLSRSRWVWCPTLRVCFFTFHCIWISSVSVRMFWARKPCSSWAFRVSFWVTFYRIGPSPEFYNKYFENINKIKRGFASSVIKKIGSANLPKIVLHREGGKGVEFNFFNFFLITSHYKFKNLFMVQNYQQKLIR